LYVQDWLPVFSQDVQAHFALQIDVGMVYLLLAEDLGCLMRELLTDLESEVKLSALVHSLVWLDGEFEVQNIVGVLKCGLHRSGQFEFRQIWAQMLDQLEAKRREGNWTTGLYLFVLAAGLR
jgi:hypothetical protein